MAGGEVKPFNMKFKMTKVLPTSFTAIGAQRRWTNTTIKSLGQIALIFNDSLNELVEVPLISQANLTFFAISL